MSETIYIAGKMTGLPEFNFPAFFAAEKKLRADGWSPINPARHDEEGGLDVTGLTGNESPEGFDLKAALLWDLRQVAYADAIYLLNGWETSKGVAAELALAKALGKRVIEQEAPPRPGPIVLGIGGHLAAGKDAFADHLVKKHGFVKVGMSDPLVEALITLNPILEAGYDGSEPYELRASETIDILGYTNAKRDYPEIRRLLQVLGTEVGRNLLGENVWVDIATRRIKSLLAEGTSVVITGVRFRNELEMIDSFETGHTLWIERTGLSSTSAHVSESSLNYDDFQNYVGNTGSLENLYETADWFLGEIAS